MEIVWDKQFVLLDLIVLFILVQVVLSEEAFKLLVKVMREVYRCREDEHFKLIKDTPRSIVDNNILISCPDFDHSLRFQPLTI